MVDINCGECARYLNYERCPCPMDECIEKGYRYFIDPHEQPNKFCKKCGLRLIRSKSEKFSNEYRKVDLKCPKHGVVAKLGEQVEYV